MVNIQCTVNENKTRFAKQIASRLHGKITSEDHELLNVEFDDASEAQKFNRFMVVIKQSFA